MLSMDEIYKNHAKTVYCYLLSLTNDRELAEELTQETFYQAVRTLNRFDGTSRVSTWLCAIAKNVLMTYRRKHPRAQELNEDIISTNTTEDEALTKASRMEILKLLHSMNEDMREVMYLRLFGDLNFRDIGDILSKTENWARVTFYRGKERLKREMDENE